MQQAAIPEIWEGISALPMVHRQKYIELKKRYQGRWQTLADGGDFHDGAAEIEGN